jgi:hypothetical protein
LYRIYRCGILKIVGINYKKNEKPGFLLILFTPSIKASFLNCLREYCLGIPMNGLLEFYCEN